jgi:hypothetical protein
MHFHQLLFLPLLYSAAALAVDAGSTSTISKVSCFTQMGTKPAGNVPTSRSTSTQNLPVETTTKTTRSTVRVTPSPKTIVFTKYVKNPLPQIPNEIPLTL